MSHLMIIMAEKNLTGELKQKVVLNPSEKAPSVTFSETRVLSHNTPSDITAWVGIDNDHLVVQFMEQRGDAIVQNWIHIRGGELTLSREVHDPSKNLKEEELAVIHSWSSPARAYVSAHKKKSQPIK